MNPDEQHVALPKLYGAPAYARPPRVFDMDERPVDPDDLPLEAFRASDEPLTSAGAVGPTWALSGDGTSTAPTSVAPNPAAALAGMPPSDAAGTTAADTTAGGVATSGTDTTAGSAAAVSSVATEGGEPPADGPALRPRPFSVRALARFLQGR